MKKTLTTVAFATVLLMSSVSAKDLTPKMGTIGAFDNIPSTNLNVSELETSGEFSFDMYFSDVQIEKFTEAIGYTDAARIFGYFGIEIEEPE